MNFLLCQRLLEVLNVGKKGLRYLGSILKISLWIAAYFSTPPGRLDNLITFLFFNLLLVLCKIGDGVEIYTLHISRLLLL